MMLTMLANTFQYKTLCAVSFLVHTNPTHAYSLAVGIKLISVINDVFRSHFLTSKVLFRCRKRCAVSVCKNQKHFFTRSKL